MLSVCILCQIGSRTEGAEDRSHERTLAAAIAAQPLARALAAFSASTRLQIVYVSQLALNKNSQAVPSGLPLDASLERLLTDTGVDFLFLNDRTVKLFERPTFPRRDAAAGGSEGREPTGGDTRGATDPALDAVVVTADKRDEILSDLPMSISVLSPADLAGTGRLGIDAIAAATTGIEYDFSSQYGPGIVSNIAIRGISANQGDATTGIYLNDTPIQSPNSTFGNTYPVSFDLARIEVLRGPQGVIFGRGAEGGAIRFITNEPSTTSISQLYRFELSTSDRGGTNLEFGAAAGGPLVHGLLGARVSAWYRADGGFINRIDPFTGAPVDADANRGVDRAVRVAVAYEPADALRITPAFSYQSFEVHDTPAFFADPPTLAPGMLNNGKLLRQPSSDALTTGSMTVLDGFGGSNLTAVSSYVDRSATATVDTTNVAGIVYLNFGNPLGRAFPTSYADAVPTLLALHEIQLSEEIRLASTDSAAPLRWVAGMFFSSLRWDSKQDTYLITAPENPGILTNDYNRDSETSAFGQARWSIGPYWDAGAGLRMGVLERHGSSFTGGFTNARSAPFASNSLRETLPPTPRLDLSFRPDGRNAFYAALAKGFRAGGIGGKGGSCEGAATPVSFGPDSVWSAEIGAKNQLFDRRLSLDVSIFDIHWNGIQESFVNSCNQSFITNAGTVRSAGFDLASELLMTDRLHVGAAIGFLDVRYSRTLRTGDGQIIVAQDTVVGGVPSVPAPWSGTLSARYEWPFLGGRATPYASAVEIIRSHNPGPFTEQLPASLNYDPALKADPATYLLNLQLGLFRADLDLHLFVNNATNSLPQLQRYPDAPGSALVYAYTLQPRTVGVRGSWAF
jgi:outer membrane receptor protein involved in Fe transport